MSGRAADRHAWSEREALIEACARLAARGLLAGTEGNLSVRLPDGSLLTTPSGADKGRLGPASLVHLHADGTPCHSVTPGALACNIHHGATVGSASSELQMHVRLYEHREDVRAVVHAHPPAATAFATAGRNLPTDVLPELIVNVGPVALVPYGRPGSVALPDAMMPWLATHEVFLLSNHGVTAVGDSLEAAVHRMESCEQAARILLGAQLLGGALALPAGEADALAAIGRRRSHSSTGVHSESIE